MISPNVLATSERLICETTNYPHRRRPSHLLASFLYSVSTIKKKLCHKQMHLRFLMLLTLKTSPQIS
jgi:hypothetical protein